MRWIKRRNKPQNSFQRFKSITYAQRLNIKVRKHHKTSEKYVVNIECGVVCTSKFFIKENFLPVQNQHSAVISLRKHVYHAHLDEMKWRETVREREQNDHVQVFGISFCSLAQVRVISAWLNLISLFLSALIENALTVYNQYHTVLCAQRLIMDTRTCSHTHARPFSL